MTAKQYSPITSPAGETDSPVVQMLMDAADSLDRACAEQGDAMTPEEHDALRECEADLRALSTAMWLRDNPQH